MRLKVEINTREHFTVFDCQQIKFTVQNPWFSGAADFTTDRLEELLATKLRALYQRKKGRDLFDLWHALSLLPVDDAKVVECFGRYLAHGDITVSRAEYEANLTDKLRSPVFLEDIQPLLSTGTTYDVGEAGEIVRSRYIEKLPGDSWKGAG
jgi:predicted nucleotidyltransferase component of viral defense system